MRKKLRMHELLHSERIKSGILKLLQRAFGLSAAVNKDTDLYLALTLLEFVGKPLSILEPHRIHVQLGHFTYCVSFI